MVTIKKLAITDFLNNEFGKMFVSESIDTPVEDMDRLTLDKAIKLIINMPFKGNWVPYLIVFNGEGVGYICMEGEGISAIYINKEHRLKGIASKAVSLILMETDGFYEDTTVQSEYRALGFWESLGYDIIKPTDDQGLTLMKAKKMNVIKTGKHELLNYGDNDMESSNIKLLDGCDAKIEFDQLTFSGGEEHIRINGNPSTVHMIARLKSSKDVMQMVMLADAVKRLKPGEFSCHIPYMPYARQDRVCNHGEALSVKVMADMINMCGFDSVEINDPHSDVTGALINNISILPQDMGYAATEFELPRHEYTLISPDAGASKKIMGIAKLEKLRNNTPCSVVEASKVRDTKTGKIITTEVHGDVNDQDCMIVDDICDGGRTFIELAKKLNKRGAKSVSLFVTHGIFSKGLNVLKEHIDHVYTTDSFCNLESDDFLTVAEVC